MAGHSFPRTDRTDGQDGQRNANCPQDIPQAGDVRGWVGVLTAEIVGHNIQGIVVRRFGGRTSICFDLKDGSKYAAPSLTDRAVEWMIAARVLDRKDFFARCPFAKNSASRHDKAIGRLHQLGLIDKQAGMWVWEDK